MAYFLGGCSIYNEVYLNADGSIDVTLRFQSMKFYPDGDGEDINIGGIDLGMKNGKLFFDTINGNRIMYGPYSPDHANQTITISSDCNINGSISVRYCNNLGTSIYPYQTSGGKSDLDEIMPSNKESTGWYYSNLTYPISLQIQQRHTHSNPVLSISVQSNTCNYVHDSSKIEYTHIVTTSSSITGYCDGATCGVQRWLGGDNWEDYNGSFQVTSRSNEITQFFRAYSIHDGVTLYSSNVELLVRGAAHTAVKPSKPTLTVKSKNSSSVTFTISGGDNGCGVGHSYQYSFDNSNWYNCTSSDNSFIYSGASPGQKVTVYARSKNNHEVVGDSVSLTEITVPSFRVTTATPGFESLRSIGIKARTKNKITDAEITIVISSKALSPGDTTSGPSNVDIITDFAYINQIPISAGMGYSEGEIASNGDSETLERITTIPDGVSTNYTYKYALLPNKKYWGMIKLCGKIGDKEFETNNIKFSFITLTKSNIFSINGTSFTGLKLPTLQFKYGYNYTINDTTKERTKSGGETISELRAVSINKNNDKRYVRMDISFVIYNGNSASGVSQITIKPSGDTGIIEHEPSGSSTKYRYDNTYWLHKDEFFQEGTGTALTKFPQLLWDEIYKSMKNQVTANWDNARIEYEFTIMDYSRRICKEDGIEYAYRLALDSEYGEEDVYSTVYTGSIIFDGTIPTAYVGVRRENQYSTEPKRAQVWVGTPNGPRKAVMYVGVRRENQYSTEPKRTI